MKPEVFLIGATNIGRDLGPRCAARLHTGLTADCTHLDVDMDELQGLPAGPAPPSDVDNIKFDRRDTNLKMTRPAFGGHLMATIICPRFRPQHGHGASRRDEEGSPSTRPRRRLDGDRQARPCSWPRATCIPRCWRS